MRGYEAVRPFVNAAAGTSATFELRGGNYVIDFVGTGTGTVVLNRLNADGVTFSPVTLTPAITVTAVDSTPVQLPPGQYQVVITTTTANFVTITRVPTAE
jgi:hypothetical protein